MQNSEEYPSVDDKVKKKKKKGLQIRNTNKIIVKNDLLW